MGRFVIVMLLISAQEFVKKMRIRKIFRDLNIRTRKKMKIDKQKIHHSKLSYGTGACDHNHSKFLIWS